MFCDIFSPMTNGSSDTDNEAENEEKLKPVEAELEEVVVEKPVSTSPYFIEYDMMNIRCILYVRELQIIFI